MIIKNVLVSISLLISVTIYSSDTLDIAQIRAEKIEELYTVCAKIAEKESAINAIIESASSSLGDANDSFDVQRKECVTKLAQDLELCMQELLECALFLMLEIYILDQDENIKKYCEGLKDSIEQYAKAFEEYLNQLATSIERKADDISKAVEQKTNATGDYTDQMANGISYFANKILPIGCLLMIVSELVQ